MPVRLSSPAPEKMVHPDPGVLFYEGLILVHPHQFGVSPWR